MKTEGNIVTVVTCTYNRSKLIGSLYDSLLKQTDKNFKWLVIDDGSSDDTCQLIDKFIDENQIEIDIVHFTAFAEKGQPLTAQQPYPAVRKG